MGYMIPDVCNRLAPDPNLDMLLRQQQQIQSGSPDYPLRVSGLTFSAGWRQFVEPSANLRIIAGNGSTVTVEDDKGIQYPCVDARRLTSR
jgi:hypothetical protein